MEVHDDEIAVINQFSMDHQVTPEMLNIALRILENKECIAERIAELKVKIKRIETKFDISEKMLNQIAIGSVTTSEFYYEVEYGDYHPRDMYDTPYRIMHVSFEEACEENILTRLEKELSDLKSKSINTILENKISEEESAKEKRRLTYLKYKEEFEN